MGVRGAIDGFSFDTGIFQDFDGLDRDLASL